MKKNNNKLQRNKKNRVKSVNSKSIKNKTNSHTSYFKNITSGLKLLYAVLSLFGAIYVIIEGSIYLKEKFWDDPPVSQFSYANLETINELKRLNSRYDSTGDSIYIDRIVEIISFIFHSQRYDSPDNFDKRIASLGFINSADMSFLSSHLPYIGLINVKTLPRDDWHDIDFSARIKESTRGTTSRLLFNPWWEIQTILDDRAGNKYTRRSIILNYAFHRLNKRYKNVKEDEIIKRFDFSGVYSNYNPKTGRLTLQGVVFRPSKSTDGSVSRNKDVLLFENIRAISGEVAETFESSFIKTSF